METWMALGSIMAIVAVVLVAGGIIAFIAHLIIGALDRTDKNVNYDGRTELLDYAKTHDSIYSKTLTTTWEGYFRSDETLFDGKNLLKDEW